PRSLRYTLIPYTTLFRSHRAISKVCSGVVGATHESPLHTYGQLAGAQHVVPLHRMHQCSRMRGSNQAYSKSENRTPPINIMEARSEEHTSELQSRENLVW